MTSSPTPRPSATLVRLLAFLLLGAVVYGSCLALDVAAHRTASWPVYVGLILAVGVLAIGAELVSGWAFASHETSRLRRAGRGALGVLVSAALMAGIYWVLSRL